MRPGVLLAAVPALVLTTAPVTAAYGIWNPASRTAPHGIDGRQQQPVRPGLATRLRDATIHWIWGPPPVSPAQATHARVPDLFSQYGDDVVLRFNISSAVESEALAAAVNDLFLDVWEHTPEWADIRMAKDTVPLLLGMLPASLQHAHTPLMHDLSQAILESYPVPNHPNPSSPPRARPHGFSHHLHPNPEQDNVFFRNYQPLSVIHPWMRLLRSLFPTHVRLVNIGQSSEGRDILGLRVGAHPTNSAKPLGPRKTILVTAGSHAREWISTASVTYAAYTLITGYGRSRGLTKLIEDFDWVFVPTLNPDGYSYTWESDRLWRKNRQATSMRFCKGLDLDRSFPYQWDGASTYGNPCSESYAGETAMEAIEAQRLVAWVGNETAEGRARFVGFLDLHSYSQQVLYPYSFSCITTPPTLETLEELGLGLAKAMRQADRRAYDVTSACEGSVVATAPRPGLRAPWSRIEAGTGSALDYMYHEAGVRYAYQIKLRDRGSYGFLLPSKDIVPSGKELFAAVTYFGRFLRGDNGIEREAESETGLWTEGTVDVDEDMNGYTKVEATWKHDDQAEDAPEPPATEEL